MFDGNYIAKQFGIIVYVIESFLSFFFVLILKIRIYIRFIATGWYLFFFKYLFDCLRS